MVPYHAPNGHIYHTLRNCPQGMSIHPHRRLQGTGDGRLCQWCWMVKVGIASPRD